MIRFIGSCLLRHTAPPPLSSATLARSRLVVYNSYSNLFRPAARLRPGPSRTPPGKTNKTTLSAPSQPREESHGQHLFPAAELEPPTHQKPLCRSQFFLPLTTTPACSKPLSRTCAA